ncbi:MAG: hypothetical protein Q7N50_00680 [Armatimonadota bacterium]|nr:hypothetical protein [Armatimonadota bacterium]
MKSGLQRFNYAPHYLLVFLVVVTMRILFLAASHLTYEDALITMRYANNIAGGHGFVYNIGERALGTTTPLFTLILALGPLLRIDVIVWSKILGILAGGISGVLIFELTRLYAGVRTAWYAVALFATWSLIVRVGVSGMETAFVVMLMLASYYLLYSRRFWAAGIAGGLLLWTRLDGIAWLGVVFLCFLLIERKLPWQSIAASLMTVAPWFIFAHYYFGSIIPNSITAKHVAYAENYGLSMGYCVREIILGVLGDQRAEMAAKAPPILLYLIGCAIALRNNRRLLAPALFPIIYLGALATSRVVIFDWYLVPAIVPLLVVAALGANGIHSKMEQKLALIRPLNLAGPALLFLIYAAALTYSVSSARELQQMEESRRKPLGLWLATETPANASVLLEPIGYIGYYSNRYILDEVGLVSPQVVKFRAKASNLNPDLPPFASIAKRFIPDYIVARNGDVGSAISNRDFRNWFERRYSKVASFSSDYRWLNNQNRELVVYERQSVSTSMSDVKPRQMLR